MPFLIKYYCAISLIVSSVQAINKVSTNEIIKELERSISFYPKKTNTSAVENYVRHIFEGSCGKSRSDMSDHTCKSGTIMLLNRKVVVFRQSFIKSKKNQKHAHMMLSAIEMTKDAAKQFPNVVYSFNGGSAGNEEKTSKNIEIPEVVISKKFGYRTPGLYILFALINYRHYSIAGIMVPNPYFGFGDLFSWNKQIFEFVSNTSKQYDWINRDPRLFWRGDISQHTDCERDNGNYARLQAVSLTFEYPDLFDIRCRKCNPRNMSVPYETYKDKDCTSKWSADVNPTFVRLQNPNSTEQVHDSVFHEKIDYARYRGLLNLPGKTYGSYSRNLNELWFLDVVVFLWATSVVEFYYPGLEDGQTHLTINKLNAHDKVSVLNSPIKSAVFIRNARIVGETFLCADCLAHYLSEFCKLFHRHFRLGLVLENASRLGRMFEESGVDCVKDLVELQISHKSVIAVDLPESTSCTALFREHFDMQ